MRGKISYWLKKPPPISQFISKIGLSPARCETDYRWRRPIVRLEFDGLRLVGRTNIERKVVKLDPVDEVTERHQLFAEAIASVIGTTVWIDEWPVPHGIFGDIVGKHGWYEPQTSDYWKFSVVAGDA